jgi:very-short-patch-repair endonuclease
MPEKQSRFTRTPALTARARTLRRQMSPIEHKLWHALRGAQLGASFRRQHPVGPYVLDFYCPSAGLAVEVDGDEHATRVNRDALRTRFLNRRGIRVIRFSNRDVWSNLRGVKEIIALELGRLGA